jgi:uncharacterized protein (DUF983 family)
MQNASERNLKIALKLGWQRRCPNCGQGDLMRTYLKTRNACDMCDQVFSHHRADDGPAYLTILVCGHILAPLLMIVWEALRPDPLVMALGLCAGFITLALYLLPRFKGAFVALQWAKRMHGFSDDVSGQLSALGKSA